MRFAPARAGVTRRRPSSFPIITRERKALWIAAASSGSAASRMSGIAASAAAGTISARSRVRRRRRATNRRATAPAAHMANSTYVAMWVTRSRPLSPLAGAGSGAAAALVET
jgi:hypothetical protein